MGKLWTIIKIPAGRVSTVAMLLVVFLNSCYCDICKKEKVSVEHPCTSKGLGTIDGRFLPCDVETIYDQLYPAPQSQDNTEVLSSFNAANCANEDSGYELGFKFSWTIRNADDNVTGLTLVISHNDLRLFYHMVNINLTQQLNHSGMGRNWTFLQFYAQVQPTSSQGWLAQEIYVPVDCTNIPVPISSFCPATPSILPTATAFCNKTVSVVFTSEPPPGIGTNKYYYVRIALYIGREQKYWLDIQRPATDGADSYPVALFHNVTAGTYIVKFAYLSDYKIPCGGNFYEASKNITVQDVLPVSLSLNLVGRPCEQRTMEVNMTRDKVKDGVKSVYNNGRLCLFQEASTNRLRNDCRQIYIPDWNPTVSFPQMEPGNYTAEFVYIDGSKYEQCSEDAVFRSELEYPCKEVKCHFRSTEVKVSNPCKLDNPKNKAYMNFTCGRVTDKSLTIIKDCCFAGFIIAYYWSLGRPLVRYFEKEKPASPIYIYPKDDNSLNGVIINGSVSPSDSSRTFFHGGQTDIHNNKSHTETEGSYLDPDSGLPPSPYDITSINDGRSRTIAV
ncbi:hypothetical protein BSL78_00248 [Apostichopus japonicus]|uniref:Uncharacterized protein n=1 Tax=Stichopus japonicus TaxID=307972 RepID=A0A2G8LR95_STIJA|nr:hypothetical protein BSL78_00248 [Apostichopus japonicus]